MQRLYLKKRFGHLVSLSSRINYLVEQKHYLLESGILVLSLVLFIFLATHRYFDSDEFQHLHIAWLQKEGSIIYRDFFDHHGPLFGFLYSKVWSLLNWSDDFNAMLSFRLINLSSTMMLLTATFFLTKKIFSFETAITTIMLLLANPIFTNKAIEFRPDTFQNAFWMAGLFCFFTTKNRSSNLQYLTGIFWGGAFLFNPKIFFAICTLFGVFWLHSNYRAKLRYSLKIISGFSFIVAIQACYFIATDNFYSAITQMFTYNIERFSSYYDFIRFSGIFSSHLLINILFIALFIFHTATTRKRYNHQQKLLLDFSFLLCFLVVSLNRHTQWYQIFLPIITIFCAESLINFKNRIIRQAAVAALLLCQLSFNNYQEVQNKNSQFVLSNTTKHEKLFFIWAHPNQGGYIFRQHLMKQWTIAPNDFGRDQELEEKIIANFQESQKEAVAIISENDLGQLPSLRKYLKSSRFIHIKSPYLSIYRARSSNEL